MALSTGAVMRAISWACYVVGILLVAGSWVNVVSGQVGWVGWAIATIGWGMQYLPGYSERHDRQAVQPEETTAEPGATDRPERPAG